MTHIYQLNRLIELQKAYKDYLPFCPPQKVAALSLEIHKIDVRINKINKMNLEEALTQVCFFFETKQSKANFKTI